MQRIIVIILISLLLSSTASVAFAEKGLPQIISFSYRWSGANQSGKDAEDSAIKDANEWMKKNFKKVRVINHSVSGNSGVLVGRQPSTYYNHEFPITTGSTGFSTVTILYIEK
ncbi:TPA: hypothetical protein DDZ49_00255 [Candidatus Wolfebacteria bacterium]|uniref:Uncharacterized protein n=1 Tax=Candidatus Wolfebacteria bacterium GW2011_GWB1_47_1 TaxID=1619007 RepID=A0A0G4AVM5_9BACT|nr:MAG: hypothetical protein UX70_C0001G1062 [Candidatus Wolfebacteria bacterium GW2011_GWB1_47_1]KKU41437.1 MAG: hypothetical protein UX58_C0008G0003 [Candidatus Wolfebacteria bacterium GW2011_GWB2_46_69]KKU53462.1 MAG: hypothetical protein UX76_C0015G0003 [Candidatus Wolfebacteria bacterium GW2011_GWC1_47_103]KKU71226.1 MAG: hypothetical protein UX96_C0025G0003 [Candidatus Wolfebacteria bacterium GW2011_GWB1_47_243]KKU75946.1 MAG: hypothetical protein UY00_C0030G0001 [Candidatus Wolfebacteria